MNSEEFRALKVGDRLFESVYVNEQTSREDVEYEVSTRYDADTVGILPVISASARRAKKKKPAGKLLRNKPEELLYYRKG